MRAAIGWLIAGALLAFVLIREAGHDAVAQRLRHEADSLRSIEARLDTVYQRDTLALTKWRTRWDSLTDTTYITDTLWVKDALATADSTIGACTVALGTCEEQKANLREQLGNLADQLDHAKPSRFGCTIGAAVTHKGFGPGATCGLRL